MSKAAAKKTTTSESKRQKPQDVSGLTIALQFLDTTWRVVIPIALLTYIGIRLDQSHGTKPLWSLVGLFSSLALAVFLVYKQIKSAYPDFYKTGGKNK